MEPILSKSEEMLFTDLINERVQDIKMKKYQGELVINEILNILKTNDKNLITLDDQNNFSRSISTIFGKDKKIILDNEKNLVLMQKLSLELLHVMIEANLVNTELVKDIIKELGDIRSDHYEIASALRKSIANINELQKRVKTIEHKLNLQEMITKIEYNSYDKDEEIYTVLNILSDLDSSSIQSDDNKDILKKCLNRNIIYDLTSNPLRHYLVKLSRMDNLMAAKIIKNLEISNDNSIVHAITDTLQFASTHNDMQKKFQFSVTALKDIMLYINVDEFITTNDILSVLLDAMKSKAVKTPTIFEPVKEVKVETPTPVINKAQPTQTVSHSNDLTLLQNLICKYMNLFTRVYNYRRYSEVDVRSTHFNYQTFFKDMNHELFSELGEESIGQSLLYLGSIFGDIETLSEIDLSVVINIQSKSSGYTPLMYASKFGKIEMVRFLIKNNANLDVLSFGQVQKTALELAIKNKYEYVAKVLVLANCEIYNKRYLRLAYTHQFYSLISVLEKRYFKEVKLHGEDILDLILKQIPKISGTYPYEIVSNKNNVSNRLYGALTSIGEGNATLNGTIGLIDSSTFRNGKEGLLFTTSGIYIRLKGNTIYQPYFFLEHVEYKNDTIVIQNINYANFHDIKIVKKYELNLNGQMNSFEFYNALKSISDKVSYFIK